MQLPGEDQGHQQCTRGLMTDLFESKTNQAIGDMGEFSLSQVMDEARRYLETDPEQSISVIAKSLDVTSLSSYCAISRI